MERVLEVGVALSLALAVSVLLVALRQRQRRQAAAQAAAGLIRELETMQAKLARRALDDDAVHLARERFSALLGAAPLTLFTVDPAGVLTAIEGESAGPLGPDLEAAVGWPAQDLFRDLGQVWRGIESALRGVRSQATVETADRTFVVSCGPLRAFGGETLGALGVALDVTELKSAERTLDEQGQLAEALVDAQSHLGDLVLVSEEGRIVFANPAATSITGYDEADLVGRESLAELAASAEAGAVERARARRRTGAVSRFEIAIRSRTGALVELELAEIELSTRGRTRVVTMGRDVTERKRAERERRDLLNRLLVAEETTRKKIAQDIHDDSIQTLFATLLRLHLLGTMISEPEAVRTLEEVGSTIDRSIQSLRHLLFDLWPSALESEGLAAALHLYLSEMQDQTGIVGSVADECRLPIDTDLRIMLYRIALEALANVRKHSQAGHAQVSLEDQDGGVLLTVRDDGRGFAVEEAESARPGHLGIDAMRERAELARGRVEIASRPGAGTTITVWIPRDSSAEQAA